MIGGVVQFCLNGAPQYEHLKKKNLKNGRFCNQNVDKIGQKNFVIR